MLEQINNPSQLKLLNESKLKQLAEEIRAYIIAVTGKQGGHIAPNLGIVELSIALHRVFSCPKDKIVWDVGHQTYVHKVLTGRFDFFKTLRRYGGIKGYPRRSESIYDCFGGGHASISISAALGFVVARDLNRTDEKIIAVIGDGALTGGEAFEAINHAGILQRDIIIILNDNGMSVDKNVGALEEYLLKITDKKKLKEKEDPVNFFANLGFQYVGPIDGHNISLLCQSLQAIKEMKGPLLAHVVTKKGKGYLPAELDATTFHEVSRFDTETGDIPISKGNPKSYREIFGETLVELAHDNKRIVAVTPAQAKATGLKVFKQCYPKRFFDVGIAEQHAVTFAAGLAAAGMKPIVTMTANFIQRSYDQIIHDVCIQNLPVIFCLDRAGFFSKEGPTHHSVFENSYLRVIPNITMMSPKDENELRSMLKTAFEINRPVVLRYPYAGRDVPLDKTIPLVEVGKCEVIQQGEAIAIIAIGSMVETAEKVAKSLRKEGVKPMVINARFNKPLDGNLCNLVGRMKLIVTLEENALMGGFGTSIWELLNSAGIEEPAMLRLGIGDFFVEHGTKAELLKSCGLDVQSVINKIKNKLLEIKKNG